MTHRFAIYAPNISTTKLAYYLESRYKHTNKAFYTEKTKNQKGFRFPEMIFYLETDSELDKAHFVRDIFEGAARLGGSQASFVAEQKETALVDLKSSNITMPTTTQQINIY